MSAIDHSLVTSSVAGTTLISGVQGDGEESALAGTTVTVEAIVVGDFQDGDADGKRNLNGFYLQEEGADSDGNAATSEGIFVFAGGTDVNVGDKVQVTGTVSEFFGQTQITATEITVVQAGAVEDVDTMAADVELPAEDVTLSQDDRYQPDLEAYEGMLVRFPETLQITEQFNLDRFNEIRLAAGERPEQFTHANDPDQAGFDAHLREIGSRTIVYDDGLNVQNAAIDNLDGFDPYGTATAPRMGDEVTGLSGVLDYQWAGNSASGSTWRVRSIADDANEFTSENERPGAPEDVGGTFTACGFNVLNYFATLDDGSTTAIGMEPRGANNADEFARQTDKLVNVLAALDVDLLGLVEIENDFLPGSSGNAIEFLVNELNAELGAGTYSWVDPGAQFVGGDAIACGFIYKPNVLEVAFDTTVETLDDSDLPALGLSNLVTDSTVGGVFNGVNTSRSALAVTFEELATSGTFTATVNHFKSKSGVGTGADADQLDGQGAWQQQREFAAEALSTWLDSDPTGSGDDDVLVLGDLNSYFQEDTIDILKGAGFENLQERLSDPYSFVFDGQIGSLDYALANESLADQITGVAEWHINADEADALDYNLDFGRDQAIFDPEIAARVSDHDPVVVGVDLEEDPGTSNFVLQLLHMADGEAGLLASDTAPIMGALVDRFDDEYANTLILSGGDNYIPGPFLSAGTDPSLNGIIGATAPARPDIAIHNAFGVEVSAIGNHEWDLGSTVFADAIRPSGDWEGAQFAHVSANLDFSGDSAMRGLADESLGGDSVNEFAGDEASTLAGKIAPWVTVTKGGDKIGILGATTQVLERISSPSGTEVDGFPKNGEPGDNQVEADDMDLLASQLQPIIDQMIASGIDKIVLQSHLQQIENEQLLATKLTGVDIILAAGSNTRLGDADDTPAEFPGHAADFADTYPIVVEHGDGTSTLIVNTDNEYTYLGRLVVEFDSDGNIVTDLLDDYVAINGAYASTEETLDEVYGDDIGDAFAEGSKGDEVRDITDAVGDVIAAKDGNVFGFTGVYLEGERSFVRTQETNLGNLSADANSHAAREAIGDEPFLVSLKNGGGIRAQIGSIDVATGEKVPPIANPDAGKPEGAVSQLDVENALRFNNRLTVFDTTPEGLLQLLNHGAGLSPGNGGFPQIGGVRFSFDPDLPPGSRVRDVALIDESDNVVARIVDDGAVLDEAPDLISVVTLNFTANGGDGYPTKAVGENFRFLLDDGTLSGPIDETLNFTAPTVVPANGVGEQQAFADFMGEFHSAPETAYDEEDTPIEEDTRIQNLDFRSDGVFQGDPIAGDDGDNVIEGTDDNELIDAMGGEDRVRAAAGDDSVLGGDRDDVLEGERGNDTVDGGGGDDVVFGDEGDDVIVLGNGNDRGRGNDGNDVFKILASAPGEDGRDHYGGGAGSDTFDFSELDGPERFRLRDGETRFRGDTITGVENVAGAGFDDKLTGNGEANHLAGDAGNDTLAGMGGDDMLDGGDDSDILNGGEGHDTLLGGIGDDTLLGGGAGGNDSLIGGEGNDELHGRLENDTLEGGEGDDFLSGGWGDDVLITSPGSDTLAGGVGADQFVFANFEGVDDIVGFNAGGTLDQIVLFAASFGGFEGETGVELVDGGFLRASAGAGTTTIEIDLDGGGDGFVAIANIDRSISDAELANLTVLTGV